MVIFKNNDENGTLLGVSLYYTEKYKDHATAIDDIKQLPVSLEYAVVATQGYIMDYNTQTQKLIPGTPNVKIKNEKKTRGKNNNKNRKTQ